MPAYSKLNRTTLLGLGTLLIGAARTQFKNAAVLDAATMAESALTQLNGLMVTHRGAATDLSDSASAIKAATESQDAGIRGLHQALEGYANLGNASAAQLRDRLFPEGLARLLQPKGRARVPEITLLLESVRAASDNPILPKLEPELSLLVAELEAFLQEAQDKNKYSQTSRGSAELLRAATESLRTLLTSLDLTIEAVTGGSKSPSYRMWAATAQGMTG
jgi:hypothetical protein